MSYGSGVAVSCGVGRRHSSDLTLLWLWCRLAATAPIGPLPWELPYAAGVALKRQKGTKKKNVKFLVSRLLTPLEIISDPKELFAYVNYIY